MKKFMEDIGTNLVVSASGEIVENLMNACRGAVSWWQLIQIPVEILTKIFLQKVGCDKIQAYGGSKLASVVTAGNFSCQFTFPYSYLQKNWNDEGKVIMIR